MSGIKNAYPEKPQVDYEKTRISFWDVISFLNNTQFHEISIECKRSAYMIFSNESATGVKGINNNYAGIQADGARLGAPWDDSVIATCVIKENMTGNERRFCVFEDWRVSVAYLLQKVCKRGLYIGGYAHPYANMRIYSEKDLARAYFKEWVTGEKNAEPSTGEILDFINQYEKTEHYFNYFN